MVKAGSLTSLSYIIDFLYLWLHFYKDNYKKYPIFTLYFHKKRKRNIRMKAWKKKKVLKIPLEQRFLTVARNPSSGVREGLLLIKKISLKFEYQRNFPNKFNKRTVKLLKSTDYYFLQYYVMSYISFYD